MLRRLFLSWLLPCNFRGPRYAYQLQRGRMPADEWSQPSVPIQSEPPEIRTTRHSPCPAPAPRLLSPSVCRPPISPRFPPELRGLALTRIVTAWTMPPSSSNLRCAIHVFEAQPNRLTRVDSSFRKSLKRAPAIRSAVWWSNAVLQTQDRIIFRPKSFSYLLIFSIFVLEAVRPSTASPVAGSKCSVTEFTTNGTFDGFVARKSSTTSEASPPTATPAPSESFLQPQVSAFGGGEHSKYQRSHHRF